MSNEPLVLHGASGCGKTSIMAMAAKQCAEWTNNKAAVVFRLVGLLLMNYFDALWFTDTPVYLIDRDKRSNFKFTMQSVRKMQRT